MADHDYVCSISGLPVGNVPVRVVLLAECEYKDGFGQDGYWYPRSPPLRAEYDRDGNEPREWENDICLRLAHDQFKKDLVRGKHRSMDRLLECMPGGLRIRHVYDTAHHAYSFSTKLGPRRPAPWVCTAVRAAKVLRAAGIGGHTSKLSYGHVTISPPRPNYAAPPAGWYEAATAAMVTAGYNVRLVKDESFGDTLVARTGTADLTLDDVRAALLSGGYPDSSGAFPIPEPLFEETTFDFRGTKIVTSVKMHREAWVRTMAKHGFRVEATDVGFRVLYTVNGKVPDETIAALNAYRRRLMACGIRAEIGDGVIVPAQIRSFESLVSQRRMRYADDLTQKYGDRHYRRQKMAVSWAVIREDVWRALLTVNTEKWRKDDGTFTTREVTLQKAFADLVQTATESIESEDKPSRYREDIEQDLAGGGSDCDLVYTIGKDPPYRVGPCWAFCHLAVMKARGEVTDAECREAVTAFAELAHVRTVMGALCHQWAPPHTGRQDTQYETIAAVHTRWGRIAEADLTEEKARRAEHGY